LKALVINSGSSSLKYTLFDVEKELQLANGIIECIGMREATFKHQFANEPNCKEPCKANSHHEAIKLVLDKLLDKKYNLIKSKDEISVIGHRVVHGGEKFSDSILINNSVIDDIDKCSALAPLHNPKNIEGIIACGNVLPGVSQVAVFDTAFHQSIPQCAYMYGLPYDYYKNYKIRKYGFHGTSHKYVAQHAAIMLKKPLNELKIITCHLGNGCSISAIENGKSVDTSMGFTPLEGVVMGTRCGDIDPAIITYLVENESIPLKEITSILNNKSGLLGLTGFTNDMRTILKGANCGNERAKMAINVYCYRIKKYISSYLGVLNSADAIVFTAGVGENNPIVRSLCCEKMHNLGIELDNNANNILSQKEREVSAPTSKVKVLVIPTNEELMIAREAVRVLTNA